MDIDEDQSSGDTPASDQRELTAKRIGYLSVVGKALMQRASDKTYQTEFLIAKQSLNEFNDMLHELDLDLETLHGMEELIKYLQVKIDKRLKSNVDMTALE